MNAPSWLCRQEQTLRDRRREQNMTVRVVCYCLCRNVLLSEILATTPLDIDQSVRKLPLRDFFFSASMAALRSSRLLLSTSCLITAFLLNLR